MLPTMALGLPHQQKRTRGQTRYSGKALLGPLLHWGEQEQRVPLLAHTPGLGVSLFLIWGEGRGVSRALAGRVA